MESDDERASPDAFATMLAQLAAHPEWDGVSCVVELVGWARPGMAEYVAWQNALLAPEQMAAERFIEIPALHQTAIFRRAAVDEVLAASDGRYRDGPAGGAAPAAAATEAAAAAAAAGGEESAGATAVPGGLAARPGDELDTPVDLWWWLSFFHCGKQCGKVAGPALFGWPEGEKRPPTRPDDTAPSARLGPGLGPLLRPPERSSWAHWEPVAA